MTQNENIMKMKQSLIKEKISKNVKKKLSVCIHLKLKRKRKQFNDTGKVVVIKSFFLSS